MHLVLLYNPKAMTLTEVRSQAEQLKTLFIGRARGAAISNERYESARNRILEAVEARTILGDIVPDFVFSCTTIDEFWWHIQPKFRSYAERTAYVQNAFQPLLAALVHAPSSSDAKGDEMAKMFLTLDETIAATGKSEAELRQLVAKGELREFPDGPRLMFKESQIGEFLQAQTPNATPRNSVCFIGHGRSSAWRELADFLERRLQLRIEEFNRESVAGRATTERIEEMLGRSQFAFLVLTAEDEHSDGTKHARENVIHEVGLFQGRLGFRKAIILLEDGCETFSNIHGLTYIPFPKNKLRAAFEDVREVLERESIVAAD